MIICQRSPVLSVPPHNDTIHYKHDRAGLRQAQIGTSYTDLDFSVSKSKPANIQSQLSKKYRTEHTDRKVTIHRTIKCRIRARP